MEDCSTDERLQQEMLSPTVDRRVRCMSRDVDETERSHRLAGVAAGRRSSSHKDHRGEEQLKGRNDGISAFLVVASM